MLVGLHTSTSTQGRLDGVDAAGEEVRLDTRATAAFVGQDAQGGNWHGAIAELIVFDRVLHPDERASIESYLYRKWGVGVP